MGSTAGIVIALSWGGVNFAWTSANVLVPLIVGLLGLVFFIYYEAKFATYPLVRALCIPPGQDIYEQYSRSHLRC